MSSKNFRSYQLSLQFYRQVDRVRCPAHLRSQLVRAASSVTLNLAEGSGKELLEDQRRFYQIALGSVRECQAVLDLCSHSDAEILGLLDQLAAHVFRLCYPRQN